MGLAEILDGLILTWLIGTWFYEGHHRKCEVHSICTKCGHETDLGCSADERNHLQ